MKILTTISILLVLTVFTEVNAGSDGVLLVDSGKLNCAVVLPENATELQVIAAEDFREVLKQATGQTLPIVREGESTGKKIPIIVGPGKLTRKLGYSGDDLEPEEFRIIVNKDSVVILAKDIPQKSRPEFQSMVTSWAFGYLMPLLAAQEYPG